MSTKRPQPARRWPAAAGLILLCACSSSGGGDRSGAGGEGSDTDTAYDAASTDECEEVSFPVSGDPPTILVLLDRSISMAMGDEPWVHVTEALIQVTAQMDYQIRFALMTFPVGQDPCEVPSGPSVGVADENAAEIAEALEADEPAGYGTPTASSMQAAFDYLVGLDDEESRQFILLATDGAPNCTASTTMNCDNCEPAYPELGCLQPHDCLDDLATIGKAAEFHESWGIDTYVVGVGGVSDTHDDVMNRIAYHGGTSEYYPAQTPETLKAAFQEIAAETTECVFDVDWESLGEGVSTDPGLVNLYADDVAVPFGADCAVGYGWHWLDGDTIELCEDLCHDYRYGIVSSIRATFGCETIVE